MTVDVARQLKVLKMLMVINKVLSQINFDELQKKEEKTYDIPTAGILPVSEEMMQLGSSGVSGLILNYLTLKPDLFPSGTNCEMIKVYNCYESQFKRTNLY